MLSRFSLVLLALLASVVAHASPLSMNDVSVLFPMPQSPQQREDLVSPSEGYFPLEGLTSQPRLLFKHEEKDMYENELRLIGVRIDPCFVEGYSPIACRKQIRLIWEPIENIKGQFVAADAAVHSFYDFDDDTWPEVLEAWRALPARNDPAAPLQVNPTLRQEGLNGPYAQALKQLLANYCTADTLTRVTVGTVNWLGNVWGFAGVNFVNGQLVPIEIAGLEGATKQTFSTDISDDLEFFGSIAPKSKSLEPWNKVLEHSVGARATLTERELYEAVGNAYTFANPKLSNPGTVDCASCHATQAMQQWSERNFARWTDSFKPIRFDSHQNLQNTSTTLFMVGHVRAFGYTANEVVIAQRTINETAAVVEALGQ